MYELYIADPWRGSTSHYFDTIDEVMHELETWGFEYVWDYSRGRHVLHTFIHDDGQTRGILAQVFVGDKEMTRDLFMPHHKVACI